MNRLLSLLVFFSLLASNVYAQPANDDCANLIDLGEAPACPPAGIYTNLDATESNIGANNLPGCFQGVQNDVWFSFTVPANGSVTDFVITVTGTTGGLVMPQAALYRGDCSGLQELFCASAPINEISVEMQTLGLTPGVEYFLRVNDYSASATPNWGEFELCVAEYVPSVNIGDEPGSSFCFGSLFDSGGAADDYQNNEDFTYTVCPDDFTQCIEVTIEDYALETEFDYLNVYAGDDVNGVGILTLTGSGSDVVVYSPDGCVTFEFTSDGFTTNEGFELSWSCSPTACDIPPFSTCDNPDVIAALPFSANDLTTCTAGNSVGPGPCDNANYMDGNEYIFTYDSPGDECISVFLNGSNSGSGISIYNDCPDAATTCVSQTGSNNVADPFVSFAYLETAGTYYITVANDLGCTPFDILVDVIECPNIFPSAAFCEDALSLNGCTVNIPAIVSVSPGEGDEDFIQPDVNNGCDGGGPTNHTFFYFRAAADGNFGFTMQAADPNEASDIDFNVYGPVMNYEDLCDFAYNNEPVRGSYAAGADPTGLADIHPVTGIQVLDELDCFGSGGNTDDFVSTLPVLAGEFYIVWINDWGNQIVSGAISIDFDQSTPNILDQTDFGNYTVTADTAVCAGSPVQLLATGGELYEWTPSTGLSCTSCPDPLATMTTSTEYQVTIFGLCDSYAQFVTVDVFESGQIEDATVCIGEVNEIYGGPQDLNITYTWSPQGDLSCTDCPAPTLTAATVGDTEYILTIEAPNCTVMDTFVYTVVNSTAPDFTIAEDTQLCLGQNTNIGGPFSPGVTYSWTSNPPGFMNAGANPNVTPSETTTYYLEASNNSCPFPSLDSVLVEVAIAPTLNVAADTFLCFGNSVRLGSTQAEQGVTYTWTPNTDLSDDTNPNPTFNSSMPGTFTYTLTAVNGACTVVESVTVEVVDIAIEVTNPDTLQICQDEVVALNAISQPSGIDVIWSPDMWLDTNIGNTVNATPQESTLYIASLTNGSCTYQDSVYIIVDSLISVMPDTTLCLGNNVVLGNTIVQPDVTYSWSPITDLVDATDPNTEFVPSIGGTFTYTLTATRGGCTQVKSITVEVITIALDIFNPSEEFLCLGDTVELSAFSLPMGTDIVWTPDLYLDTNLGNSITSIPLETTTYTATISNGICTYIDSVVVYVDSLPEDLAIMPLDTAVCQGSLIQLTTTTYEPAIYPDIEFLWTPAVGFESPDSLLNMVLTANIDQTYTRRTTNGGCTSFDTARVEILPILVINIDPPEPVICTGESIQLDSDADTMMLENILWMSPAGLSCINCSDPIATPESTTTYTVTATQPNGCPAAGTVSISVRPYPLIILPEDQTDQCVGAVITLNSAAADPNSTYTWTSSDPNFSSNDPNPVVTLNEDVTYTVTAENGVCPPVVKEITFNVAQPPTSYTVSPDVTICSGDEITLEANGSEEGTYTWTPGPDNRTIDVSPSVTTTYNTTYTWGPNCGTLEEEVVVTVEEGFEVMIASDAENDEIAEGATISLSAFIEPATADITTYVWTANGIVIGTNSPTVSHIPIIDTEYIVIATSSNGCTSQDSYSITVIPPAYDIPSAFTPDGDNINDTFYLITDGDVKMEYFQIFNRWGQKVFETRDVDVGWDGTFKGIMAPSDVYVYVIKLNLLSGEVIEKGDVTLIR